jgi:N-acetyl-1-D-myo-inositol-2-amino-2-deoxy-alpha-D-glucopyranoside deacetylase
MPPSPDTQRRILAIFAHPDDELAIGGLLARYAAEGVAVTLACATRGEAATIYSPPEYGATPENLAQVRTREMECCCAALGIEDLRWLDWPDGGVAGLDRDQATAQVVGLLRALRPHLLFTHPEHGGYPHPDHIAVHQIVLAAWQAAADPAYRPELGPPWVAAKLYVRVFPASFFESNPAFAQFRVQLNGQQLPFFATPDEEISTTLDVSACAERRTAAWDCHRSQHNPQGMWSEVSDEARHSYISREALQLIAHHLPDAPQPESDLWAGIAPSAGTAWAEEASAAAADEADAPIDAASAAAGDRLLIALRSRRTYLLIYQDYLKSSPKPDFAELLATLIDHTQELIALLSGALRRIDRSPLRAGLNEKLLGQAGSRKGAAGKLNFIVVGAARNLDWYAQQLAQNDPPAIKAIWQELITVETQDQQLAKELLALIEQSTGNNL